MKKYFLYTLFFVLIFCFTYFFYPLGGDELWIYGFSKSIADGLVPYRDFNMIVTPLYPFLGALFVKLFGGTMIGVHILNALMETTLFIILYKMLEKKSFIIIPWCLLFFFPGYNSFCILLMIILIYVLQQEFKQKDIVMAFFISLMFLTKQTLGILLIPLLLYSKNKKKVLITFLIPNFILLCYLLITKSFMNFFDYCFLGMLDFTTKNGIFNIITIFQIIVVVFLVINLIRSKFKNSELFYVLCFQIVTFPLCDPFHFSVGFVPVLYLIIKGIGKKFEILKNRKIIYGTLFVATSFLFLSTIFSICSEIEISLTNDLVYAPYRNIDYGAKRLVLDAVDYIEDKGYDKVFIVNDSYGYLIKLQMGTPLTKYDLLNDGNMGYHGYIKYIKEFDKMCSNELCAFLVFNLKDYPLGVYKTSETQTNYNIVNYIVNKYTYTETINNFDVFIK